MEFHNGYEFSQEFLQRFIKNKNWKKVGRKEEKDEMIVEITEGLSKLQLFARRLG